MTAAAARRLAMLALVGLGSGGCTTGLFQTAKTLPYGERNLGLGAARLITNRNAAVRNEATAPPPSSLEGFTMPEAGMRVGLGRQTDLGFGSYLGLGLRADAKHNLLPDAKPYALAPRLGLGAATSKDRWLWAWLAGLIASYDLNSVFSFYSGASFVAHYIHQPAPQLPPGERLVGRTPWGDGLLQLALGIEARFSSRTAIQAEYGRWLPLQNDPGDGYRFVPAHLVGGRVVFGL